MIDEFCCKGEDRQNKEEKDRDEAEKDLISEGERAEYGHREGVSFVSLELYYGGNGDYQQQEGRRRARVARVARVGRVGRVGRGEESFFSLILC